MNRVKLMRKFVDWKKGHKGHRKVKYEVMIFTVCDGDKNRHLGGLKSGQLC